MRTRLALTLAALGAALWTAAGPGRAATPRFFSDDPIWVDPETEDASALGELPVSEPFDFVENSFLGAGDRTDTRAVNVNTVDEVPDSSWFTNRIGRETWTVERMARGPDTGSGPVGPTWTIVAGKAEGVTPGVTIRDGSGQLYFIKFDPPSNPEMASGAELISTKFFHAMGYHVPENYIASLRTESLVIGDGTMIEDVDGVDRPMREADLRALLKNAARAPDGSFRVLASKALPGRRVGRFRYHGTRPDDPNDIFPHEHRRELRGLSVFAAWLNHDDSRSINTYDALVPAGDRSIVRHYLLDFGSTLGSGSTRAQSTRAGNEYIWESRPTFVTMLTLGLYVRPWVKVAYPEVPSVGRFEATYFRPEEWKPEYPNPAFLNARPEDRFWAARIVAGFSEEAIRAIVKSARYSDPQAGFYLADVLMARRMKILLRWLNGTNPVVDPRLSAAGELTFGNAAEDAHAATPGGYYTIQWSRFDNATGTHEESGDEQTTRTRRALAPKALLASRPDYVAARIRGHHQDHRDWSHPLMVYFRHTAGGWSLVGLERNP
jgi:hypothetical protein